MSHLISSHLISPLHRIFANVHLVHPPPLTLPTHPTVPTTATPSAAPTLALVLVQATQSVGGVTVAEAESDSFKTAFRSSVALKLKVPDSSIVITGATATSRRLEDLENLENLGNRLGSGTDGSSAHMTHTTPLGAILPATASGFHPSTFTAQSPTPHLLTSGVSIIYTVTTDSSTNVTAVTTKLAAVVTDGSLEDSLVSAGFPAFVVDTPAIVDISPTRTPTLAPTIKVENRTRYDHLTWQADMSAWHLS